MTVVVLVVIYFPSYFSFRRCCMVTPKQHFLWWNRKIFAFILANHKIYGKPHQDHRSLVCYLWLNQRTGSGKSVTNPWCSEYDKHHLSMRVLLAPLTTTTPLALSAKLLWCLVCPHLYVWERKSLNIVCVRHNQDLEQSNSLAIFSKGFLVFHNISEYINKNTFSVMKQIN